VTPPKTSSVSQFLEERKFLKNCTPKTQAWHAHALLKAFAGCTTEADYKQRIIELRQRGVSPTSVNSWKRSVNAYLKCICQQSQFCATGFSDTLTACCRVAYGNRRKEQGDENQDKRESWY
jgi:hypothetical protein